MKALTTYTVLLACVLVLSPCARGQQTVRTLSAPYESDVMTARPVRYWLGVILGGNGYFHRGSYSPNCECAFSGESGARFSPGLAFIVEYPKLGLSVSFAAHYHDYSARFAYTETRNSIFIGNDPDSLVEYEKSSDVSLQYIRLVPSLFWYIPYTSVFFSAGLDLGFPLHARYDNRERIVTPGVLYKDGGSEITLLPEQDVPGGKNIKVSFALGVGGDLRLTTWLTLTPRLAASLPLSSVSSEDPSWKVLTVQGDLMIRVRL